MAGARLSDALSLPCGAVLPNRIAKAAMTEGLADRAGRPTAELTRLYERWGAGGAGLLLSGNVQIDAQHLERPGNVIVDSEPDAEMLAAMREWTAAATAGGAHFWAQISHAGRQTQKAVNPHPKAPSAVKLGLPGGQFGEPVAMTEEDIAAVVKGFARAARVCRQGGFTGVQVHAAHGYLLSQFLSPRSNQRSDQWGGTLENRARLLLDVVAAVRAAVGDEFPVAVKLNSADFQKGGFGFEDALQVADWLAAARVDLIEVSGGTYEQPKLLGLEGVEPVDGQGVKESTLAREAYFVDFARAMQARVSVPLMVTGGLRRRDAMEEVLASGAADVIGVGRPMCVMTDAPAQLLNGLDELPRYEKDLKLFPAWLGFLRTLKLSRTIEGFAGQYWFYGQLYALGRTGAADPDLSVMAGWREVERTHKAWLQGRGR
ncbi:MAG: NADH:flavin oxidoreductase/NADH oxidase family protein [Sphingopyxis sp.]|nr:NADH:flavin oxidoreductase/NADH oxidase family protein [Sphingopyxis sp.]